MIKKEKEQGMTLKWKREKGIALIWIRIRKNERGERIKLNEYEQDREWKRDGMNKNIRKRRWKFLMNNKKKRGGRGVINWNE